MPGLSMRKSGKLGVRLDMIAFDLTIDELSRVTEVIITGRVLNALMMKRSGVLRIGSNCSLILLAAVRRYRWMLSDGSFFGQRKGFCCFRALMLMVGINDSSSSVYEESKHLCPMYES